MHSPFPVHSLVLKVLRFQRMFAGGEIAIEDSRLFSARPIPEQRFLKKFQFLLCYGIRHSNRGKAQFLF